MVDITKLIGGQVINRLAQPVEPSRRVQAADNDEQRRQAQPSTPTAVAPSGPAPDPEEARSTAKTEVKKWAESVNDFLKANNMSLRFQVSEDAEQIVVKIVNNDTGEVIRQIPSEELVELAERMREAAGLLVDSKL